MQRDALGATSPRSGAMYALPCFMYVRSWRGLPFSRCNDQTTERSSPPRRRPSIQVMCEAGSRPDGGSSACLRVEPDARRADCDMVLPGR